MENSTSGKRKSIKGKINKSILIVLIPSLFILIAVSCTIAVSTVTTLLGNVMEAQSNNAVNQVDGFFDNKIMAVSMFQNNVKMQDYLQRTPTKATINSYLGTSEITATLNKVFNIVQPEGVQAVWLAGARNGTYLMYTGELVDVGYETVAWDESIQSSKKAIVTEPFLDPASNKMVISIVSPVFSPSGTDVIGYMGFDVFQENLEDQLSGIKVGKSGNLEILSNTGTYIYSQDSSIINQSVKDLGLDEKFVQMIMSKQTGNINYSYGNERYKAVIKQISNTGWIAVANIPVSEQNEARNQLLIVLLGLSVVILVVIIFTIMITVRKVTSPIRELTSGIEEFANGNLEIDIATSTNDELGVLADSMRRAIRSLKDIIRDISQILTEVAGGNLKVKVEGNYVGDFMPIKDALTNIIHSLNDTLSQINQSAEQVSSGSEQVSSGSQALSQGATEQASSVEELAATINEISAQVKENADHAKAASQKADQVGTEMVDSNQKMQEMIHAMDEISASSGEIGKIIKTIEDIAFQTNILALNAAVEAARAGSAGKGFAVVADEVRNLAGKSAAASKDTAALIEHSVQAVDNGSKIADETAQAMLAAVEGTKEVTSIIDKISTASQAQASSINQVQQGVDQISSVVQTNSATAEQSAAASEELAGQAMMLKELVSKFTLDSSDTNQVSDPYFTASWEDDLSKKIEEQVQQDLQSGYDKY